MMIDIMYKFILTGGLYLTRLFTAIEIEQGKASENTNTKLIISHLGKMYPRLRIGTFYLEIDINMDYETTGV
jgi:hypothetical protein